LFPLGLFTANAAVISTESGNAHPPASPHIMLTVLDFLVMLYAGFKGWDLVQTHHIGVDMNANEEIPAQEEVEQNANEIFANNNVNAQK
jgi:hypothetical protein